MKNVYLLLFFMLAGTIAMAQTHVITGFVRDSANSTPIQAATVKVKGKNTAVVTGVDGGFSINVPITGAVLEISYVGYGQQDITVTADQTNVIILLGTSSGALNEVVVTALGITRQSKSLVYATQSVKTSELTGVRDPNNLINSLQGKVANAVISQGSGGPGSGARIVLRGNRSIQGSNNALIVVDGVPINNSTYSTAGSDFGSVQGSDGASNINPDDIESVTVLRGASAATLYGSAGANGAIIITTKKGSKDRYSVSFNSGFTSETPFALPAFQNEYGQGLSDTIRANRGESWGPKMTGQTYTNYLGQQATYTAQKDNIRDFFRNGVSFNNSVGISGGSDRMQTFFSYTNNAIQGIVPRNDLLRHIVTVRVSNHITKNLSSDAKITYISQRIDNRPRTGEENAPVIDIYQIPRSVSTAEAKQYDSITPANIPAPTAWPSTLSSIYQNPYWTVNRSSLNEHRDRVIGFISLKYQFTKWLSLTGRANLDKIRDVLDEKYYDGTILWTTQGGGYYSKGYITTTQQWYDAILSGNNSFAKDFKVSYNLGAIFQDNIYNQDRTYSDGLNFPDKFSLAFAKNLTVATDYVQSRTQSVFGQATVSWKDGLYLDGSVRTDWASPLPPPYHYTYYGVGLSGVISDLAKLPAAISFLKANVNYAQAGNGGQPQIRFPVYTFSQGAGNGLLQRSPTLPIPDLKPEISKSWEAGLEARFAKNRIGFTFNYYTTNSIDQLLTIALPVGTGYSTTYINAGNIKNHGFELVINGTPVQTKNFSWDVTLNASLNRNKVVKISPDIKTVTLGGLNQYGRSATPIVQEGGSYGDMLAYKWATDSATGQYLVDKSGLPLQTGSQQIIGNFNPKENLGFTNTFTYKGFSLRFLIDGRIGGTIVSGTEMNLAFSGITESTLPYREGGWVLGGLDTSGQGGDKASIRAQQFWQTASGKRYGIGQFFAYNATSFRVREASLGYTFTVPQGGFVKGASLSVVARNLFWLYRGKSILDIPGVDKRTMPFDPDMSLGNGNFQGVEYGTLPSTRSVGVNLRLSF